MPELASKSQCTGCTACVSICPCHCIKMQKDDAGFLFPEMIERSACIGCGACEQVCSVLADEGFDGELSTVAYAAFSKNNLLRMGSSSGGFFRNWQMLFYNLVDWFMVWDMMRKVQSSTYVLVIKRNWGNCAEPSIPRVF